MQVKISQSWSNRMSACLAAYNTTHTHTKLLFTRISRRQSCVVHITEVKANTIHYVSQLFTNCATWCIHTQRRNPFLRPSPFIIIISNSESEFDHRFWSDSDFNDEMVLTIAISIYSDIILIKRLI